jgi:hypothetical protein
MPLNNTTTTHHQEWRRPKVACNSEHRKGWIQNVRGGVAKPIAVLAQLRSHCAVLIFEQIFCSSLHGTHGTHRLAVGSRQHACDPISCLRLRVNQRVTCGSFLVSCYSGSAYQEWSTCNTAALSKSLTCDCNLKLSGHTLKAHTHVWPDMVMNDKPLAFRPDPPKPSSLSARTTAVLHIIRNPVDVILGTVRVFRQKFTLEDAIVHACSLNDCSLHSASRRVTNIIPLGCTLFVPVHAVNCHGKLRPNTEGFRESALTEAGKFDVHGSRFRLFVGFFSCGINSCSILKADFTTPICTQGYELY